MKVVLLKNVDNLGQAGEVKEVKLGYWRNFLMPNGLAAVATPGVLKDLELKEKMKSGKKEEFEQEISKSLPALKDQTITVQLKADQKGSLFAGVDAQKISQFIKEKLDINIPAEIIGIKKPIKEIGLHKVPIQDIEFNLEIQTG
jgi:large subunit ribosomal protein L9